MQHWPTNLTPNQRRTIEEGERAARQAGRSGDGSCGGGPVGKSAHERAGGKPMQGGSARRTYEAGSINGTRKR